MATPTRTFGGGVQVEGLRETLAALKRVDREFGKEANKHFRTAAIDIKNHARRRAPGGSRMGLSRRVFGHRGSGGAAVVLKATLDPRANAAEFGEDVAHVPRRGKANAGYAVPVDQATMRRRTARPHRPPTSTDMRKNRGGYMVQPALRVRLPYWDREIAKQLTLLIQRAHHGS